MESMGLWGVVVDVAMIAALAWLAFSPVKSKRSVEDWQTTFGKAFEDASNLVNAAEQLWETGQIKRTERFDYAYTRLHSLWPALNEDLLEAAVEAAVRQGKAWRERTSPTEPVVETEE
jgi:hypothetical protein